VAKIDADQSAVFPRVLALPRLAAFMTGNRPMENDRAYTIGVVLLGTVPAAIVVILLLL
jgi:hypothetical protein